MFSAHAMPSHDPDSDITPYSTSAWTRFVKSLEGAIEHLAAPDGLYSVRFSEEQEGEAKKFDSA
ncbi:hypothetical protein L861_11580 [Litchfieldella anticariensis FP35 = DSM 16096]|uniref:Uncharacterized protein n=1 Tax=Litchfieldella anticariensis (strain DSM 16096 / CECT 5854 / CIP 108499 / LMG 22089 / FP35) TaxID=1121939 RepID=S2KL87_LITA3|nr:hypothetical protein L861_11580 [Halomonas anticariensis FP35 = DSM 16096]